jgi:electron transport complex protein RnfC
VLNLFGETFRHGVHPPESKGLTEHVPIRRMPFPDRIALPLRQHAGKPARCLVQKGDRVQRGDKIAEADGYVSVPIHASAAGTVVDIGWWPHPDGSMAETVIIDVEEYSPQIPRPRMVPDWQGLTPDQVRAAVQDGGVVGLGGAAFPTHVKLAPPKDLPIEWLLVNGAECEPYLTTDHRIMLERADAVVRGAEIVAARLGVEETVFGIELNKPDAIEAITQAIGDRPAMRVAPVRVKYPQGAEKMLIKAIYGEEVPSGGLPLDVETLVNNVATMVGIADYFDHGQPFIERVITVAGPGVAKPANLLVPVGTPVRAVLDHVGGLTSETREVVMGGPMMGTPLASLDVPVLKGTSGLIALTEAEVARPNEYTCIKCGRCADACPQFLNPSRLGRLARAGRYADMERFFVMDCVECGSCSFACPSGIPIVQLIRVAKSAIRAQKSPAK